MEKKVKWKKGEMEKKVKLLILQACYLRITGK